MFCGDLNGKETQKRGNICICTADSLCCTVETKRRLSNNYESESESRCCVWLFPDCIVHGILQARILQWVAFPFSKGSSQPRDRTQVSCTAGRFFTRWATKEAPRNYTPIKINLKIKKIGLFGKYGITYDLENSWKFPGIPSSCSQMPEINLLGIWKHHLDYSNPS